jgi:hypothetical protein
MSTKLKFNWPKHRNSFLGKITFAEMSRWIKKRFQEKNELDNISRDCTVILIVEGKKAEKREKKEDRKAMRRRRRKRKRKQMD